MVATGINFKQKERAFDFNDIIEKYALYGKSCIEALYNSDPEKTIDLGLLRYRCFQKRTTSTACKLHDLPPTTAVANQHTLRVYLQVQHWFYATASKLPCEYGWEITSNGLMLIILPKRHKTIAGKSP
ncbi:hypothetical protein FQA39_LY13231 [Lamprigera yunnana]|nr:hypothetical protein FQA39_LY13231 [Lamprigera yunnana]